MSDTDLMIVILTACFVVGHAIGCCVVLWLTGRRR